jgi:2-keto-3-deoxy-L-rhamnonate aldolase RhmA
MRLTVRQNHTLATLRQGKPTIGLWLHNHNFHVTRAIAAQGLFDWLAVDLEHTPTDPSSASMILSAIGDVSGGKCTPIARVAHGTMYHIKQALDSGAQGIVVPMINTAEQAADVVRFARYPPQGERGGGGMSPHIGFGMTNHAEYIPQANAEIMVSVQIESREAVENIDAIVETPGLDMIFIGTFDLHISLGLAPILWDDNPTFRTAVDKVISACRRHNLPYGTLTPNADASAARLADGFTFVSMGTDMIHLLGSINAQYAQLKKTALEK